MTRPESWAVISGDYQKVELDGAGKEGITLICRTDDELPSATEEMEQRVAKYDSMMERSKG